MKVCCIGDIHGTDKFLTCYKNILEKDNDCDKIIVFGDHFDPYEHFTIEEMVEKYNKFSDILKEDERIVSLLGNHDLSYYIIQYDRTNRTHTMRGASMITNCIKSNLDKSYLVYKIDNWLFSHAGVSQEWYEHKSHYFPESIKKILTNQKGWTTSELTQLVKWYEGDFSGYGDNTLQGCTWIRPSSLCQTPFGDYNQVVAHTRVDEIEKVEMSNGKDLWLIDNCGKPEYLTLEI